MEIDEEGLGDVLLDENAVSTAPRPGTSFSRPMTNTISIMRPLTRSGRPLTGFIRPGSSRPITG